MKPAIIFNLLWVLANFVKIFAVVIGSDDKAAAVGPEKYFSKPLTGVSLIAIFVIRFLVILNKLNGQIIRSTNLKKNLKNYDKNKNNFQGFVIAKNKILISQDNKIIRVSIKDGQIEKVIKVDGNIISRPFISNKEMIVVSENFIRSFK